jgi:hypothetical protein
VESVTVVPRERMRTRQFALALEGASSDPSLTQMTRVAGALNNAGGATVGPSDDFRAALRQRLVAVGAVAPVRPIGGMPQAAPWRRRLVAASVALAISTGGAAATAVASTGALPGDRLYEVKRAVEIVQLALAPSDLAKGERYLAIASARMSEVQGLLRGGDTSDLVLIEELRRTLSDMSDAVAAGSARYFEVYNRTLDAGVLAPLERFLAERSAGLASVRELLPVELLDKQGTMLVELESIARRVATATGRPQVTGTIDAPSTLAVASSRELAAASRGQTERDLGAAKLPLDRVRALGSALTSIVGEAVAKLPSSSSSATTSKPAKSEVASSVHTLMAPTYEDDADASEGTTLSLSKEKSPSARATVGIVREIRATADTASSRLLGALPLPNEADHAVPGSLSTGLDIGLTRDVTNIIPLHKN